MNETYHVQNFSPIFILLTNSIQVESIYFKSELKTVWRRNPIFQLFVFLNAKHWTIMLWGTHQIMDLH